ncbi:hypothetical protein TSA1_09600 [Bradyrhizobium nitroreducens]|uniref:Uncharacterized protein n=1 Tax=Bradyrhizobium nitroreducens TaxID=709803 RepID=A0A2M6U8T0_9BRAD|nr:glycosyltransferase family 4 protein [Bradyrhizobium nitroreducens]PIT00985.1 hypothetical protein TSA1_09600 [Bradyrhizobium nitroreducens]
MRILVVTQYFWPESFIVNDMVRWLAESGHSIVVAAGKPSYPSGNLAPGYTRHGVQYETFAGIEVVRIPSRPRYTTTALNLALNYLSFAWSGLLRLPWVFGGRDFDVVLVFAMPITAALPAVLLCWTRRCHLALWVQDLWPQVVTSTGVVRSRLVVAALDVMVGFIYRAANSILVQSKQFVAPISKIVPQERIVVLPNFAPPSEEQRLGLPEAIERLFHDRFSVVFAGNLGGAQSLATIVDAARNLRLHPEIRIIVAGAGSHEQWMTQAIAAAGLTNVEMVGMLDSRMMPELFELADCLLVTLSDHPALAATIPSKVQTYMKAGRPIVGAMNGATADLIEVAGAGIAVQAENGAGLARSIIALSRMPESVRLELGRSGRAYYEEHFTIDKVLNQLVRFLKSRTGCHV